MLPLPVAFRKPQGNNLAQNKSTFLSPFGGFFIAGILALLAHATIYAVMNRMIDVVWWRTNYQSIVGISAITCLLSSLVIIWKRDKAIKSLIFIGIAILVGLSGLAAAIAVVLLVTAALSIGDKIIQRRSFGHLWIDLALTITVGFVVILTIISLSVHWEVNYTFLYYFALIGVCFSNFKGILWYLKASYTQASEARLHGIFSYISVVSSLSLVSLAVFFALTPTLSWDGLVTHLWMPEYVKLHGRWDFDYRNFVWALMPLGCDWLYTPAVLLGGESAAKLLNLTFVCLGCVLIGGTYARHADIKINASRTTALVLLLLFSSPIGIFESSQLFDDSFLLVLYAAVFLLLTEPREIQGKRWGIALGVLLGGAIASKLTGTIFAAVCGIVILFILFRNHTPRVALHIFLLGAIVLLGIGGIPYAYAWWQTANPVFPFFNAFFGSPDYARDNFLDGRWVGHLHPSLLFDMTFHSDQFIEGRSGALGFEYWILLPFAFIWGIWRRRNQVVLPIVLACLYAAGIFINEQYLRYVYPIFPLFLWVIARFVLDITADRRWTSRVIYLCFTWACVLGMMMWPSLYELSVGIHPGVVLFNKDRTRFLERATPVRLLTEDVNADMGDAAHLLLNGQSAVGAIGLQGSLLYNNWYNQKLQYSLSNANSDEDILGVMREYSVTHVIFSPAGRPENEALFAAFLRNHGQLLATLSGLYLYRLDMPEVFAYPLTRNGNFKQDLREWYAWSGAITKNGNAARLAPEAVLGQNFEVSKSRSYFYSATIACPSSVGEWRLKIEWRDKGNKTIGVYDQPGYCIENKGQTLEGVVVAPSGVDNANVIVFNGPSYAIDVANLNVFTSARSGANFVR